MNKNQLLNIKKMIFELGRRGSKNHFFDRVNDTRGVERFFASAQNDDCENAGKRGRAARNFSRPLLGHNAGRSMLEMLGVLAIVGVLSIGGLVIYQYSMAKKSSNDLWSDVMLHATSVATSNKSLDDWQGGEQIDTELTHPDSTFPMQVFKTDEIDGFVVDVEDVRKAVCKHTLNLENPAVEKVTVWNDEDKEIQGGPEICLNDHQKMSFYFSLKSVEKVTYCVPACPAPKFCRDNRCVCPASTPKHALEETCECEKSHIIENNTCVCPLNQIEKNDKCVCPEGLNYWVDGTGCVECTQDSHCQMLEICNLLSYRCECDTASNEIYDGVCVPKCVLPLVRNPQTKGCSCPAGTPIGADTATCQCKSNEVVVNGRCEVKAACSICQTYDAATNTCYGNIPENGADCCAAAGRLWSGSACCAAGQVVVNGRCECPQIDSCTSYDENCLCTACESPKIVNSDGTACECPEGTIFVDGTCQEFHCIEIAGATKTYSCYLNGKWCASLCTSPTPKNAGDCSGYCNPKFCDGKGTWLQEPIPGSGFGCLASNGLYCGTYQKSSMKMCTRKTSALQTKDLCCEAYGDFGVCTRGTCDASDCDAFGGTYTYVADRRWGCEITKNNYTAYCTPFDGSWNCQYAPAATLAISGNPNFCGRCSASELAAGNCGNCFNGIKNCSWGEYDAELDRCVGTLNGLQMSCDFSGNCYYGASKDSNRCAYNCDKLTPGNNPVCHYGMCDETACPAGSEFVYMAGTYLNIYGCQTKRDGYTFFYKDGDAGHNNACFIGQSLCGGDCTKDCSSCEVYYLEACASGRCLKNGSLIDKDNDGVADCTCEGSATNGHCCEKGHVYLNGGCTQLSCPEGQCVTDGGLCKTLTSDICRDDSGLCQTVGDEFARDDNTGACVSK